MSKQVTKEQFGAHAESYLTSPVHARGGSLERLVALVKPRPSWQVLDVATGAGHTALTFAPLVERVWATDFTPEMLELTAGHAQERGLDNVTVEEADAEKLPFEPGRFDLVTCRIAPHHFGDIPAFLRESARVLRPGGLLAVADNVVPTGKTGLYVNAWEKMRDPSHHRCLTLEEWLAAFRGAGFQVLHQETLDKRMTFDTWAQRHDPLTRLYIRVLLLEAPAGPVAHLQPRDIDGVLTFRLQEAILVGQVAG